MNLAFLAFLVNVVVSLLSFTLIASWYVVPRLSKQPYVQALLPLVLLNAFRTEGFVFPLPTGNNDGEEPRAVDHGEPAS